MTVTVTVQAAPSHRAVPAVPAVSVGHVLTCVAVDDDRRPREVPMLAAEQDAGMAGGDSGSVVVPNIRVNA